MSVLLDMKNILFMILVVAFVGLAVFFSGGKESPVSPTVPEVDVSMTGIVTAVDRSQVAVDGPVRITAVDASSTEYVIAVPSLSIQLCAAGDQLSETYDIAVGDILSVRGSVDTEDRIVPCADAAHYLIVHGVLRDTALGYELTYRKSPSGYVSRAENENTHADYVTGVSLVNKKEYEDFVKSDDVREGPPAMYVSVYTNQENLAASEWATQYPTETGADRALTEPEPVVVGEADAVRYIADGLYPVNTYVVTHEEYVYVLMGAYREPGDQIATDFASLVQSFAFVQNDTAGEMEPAVEE